MDFDYTPQEEEFRHELRSWLEANPPEGYDPETFDAIDPDVRYGMKFKWQKKLHAANLVGIHWPKEHGGRGATIIEQTIYQQEMARTGSPHSCLSGPILVWSTT